jgi:hypothetical protein
VINALIGYTGFVGGNLARQCAFTHLYNRANVSEMAGLALDQLVCAAAPGVKWKANAEPEKDRQAIADLERHLSQVRVKKLVLISTVDVYRQAVDVDEATAIDPAQVDPYGKHRYELEQFVSSRFDSLVVRLPALFGPGLKKNVVFDFLNDNGLSKIHCESVFQFYPIERLWKDVEKALADNLSLVNFATEPVSVAEVAYHGFGLRFENRPGTPPANYDMKSRHANLFGGKRGYLYEKADVLAALAEYVRGQRKHAA